MRLNHIGITQFGALQNRQVSLSEKGITLIRGHNEAGKTTLLNFLRFILFGQVDTLLRPYFNLSGEKSGGVLEGSFSDGSSFKLERLGYKKGKTDFNFQIAGERATEKELYARLSSAGLDLYRNIYAISLRELADYKPIAESGMEEKIFSEVMGMGSLSPGKARKSIEDQVHQFYKYKGKNQLINNLKQAWLEKNNQAQQLKKNVDHYEELSREIIEKECQLESSENQLEELNKELKTIDSCLKSFDDYLALTDAQKQLEKYPDEELPQEGLSKLNRYEQEIERLENNKKEAEEELHQLKEQLEGIQPDERLVAQEASKEDLEEEAGSYTHFLEDKRHLESEIKSLQEEIEGELAYMGIPSVEELSRISAPLETWEEATGWQEKLERRERDYREAQQNLDQKDREIKDLQQQKQQWEAKLKELDEEKVPEEQELKEKFNRMSYLEREMDKWNQENARRKLLTMIGGIIGTIVALGGVSLITFFGWLWPGVVLLAVGILVFGGFLLWFKPAEPAGEVQEELEKEKLQWPITEKQLLNKRNELNQLSEKAASKTEARKELEKIAQQERGLENSREEQRLSKEGARKTYEGTWKEWSEFLSHTGLPSDLKPAEALNRIEKIRQLQTHQKDLADKETRLQERKGQIQDFKGKFRKALTDAGKNTELRDDEVSSAFRQWKKEVEENLKEAEQRRHLEKQIEEKQRQLEKIEQSLTEVNEAINALLKQARAESADDFRKKYQNQEYRAGLKEKIREKQQNLQKYCGGNDPVNDFKNYWEMGAGQLGASRDSLEEKMANLNQEVKALREEISAKRQEQRELEKQGSLSEVHTEMEQIENQMHEAYKEWLAGKVALEVLNETQAYYQREHQPNVVKQASPYFHAITGGQYTLEVALDEQDIKAVDAIGNTKALYQLSRGTLEQMLLALRLGLIEEYEKNAEPLPFIMDDIMVNFDPQRASKAGEAIEKFAADRQVLHFTCHPGLEQLYENAHVVDLEKG